MDKNIDNLIYQALLHELDKDCNGGSIFRRIRNIFTNEYSPVVENAIKTYGNWYIRQVYIGRTPVQQILQNVLNTVSSGEFSKHNYDELYHLFAIFEIQNGIRQGEIKYFRTEKTPNITWSQTNMFGTNDGNTNYVKLSFLAGSRTVAQMFQGAQQILGNNFNRYDPVNNNCQSYILALMHALGKNEADEFIQQDINTLTGNAYNLAKATTNLGHTVGRIGEVFTSGGNVYKFHKKIDGVDFYAPSNVKNKKYDAFINGKKYSFGDIGYEQYFDKIGYYDDMNHMDKKRRTDYRSRHRNDNLDNYSPGYFSYYYLW